MGLPIATNQQINNYYDFYRDREIAFTKNVIRSLRMDPRQVYVKCGGSQWPCIVNSMSFLQTKIILGRQGGAFQEITKEGSPAVNLRLYFNEAEGEPLIFFVTARVSSVNPYQGSSDLAIITLTYTQRPPDDFIYKIGRFIEVCSDFDKYKAERISMNTESKRRLSIDKEETVLWVQGVPRRCVLRDVSFDSCHVVFLGLSKFIQDKECTLRVQFVDPFETVDIKGRIVSTDAIAGRQDMVMARVQFTEDQIPLSYKTHISDCLASFRKTAETNKNVREKSSVPVK